MNYSDLRAILQIRTNLKGMSIGHCRLHFYYINVKFNNDAHLCFTGLTTIFEIRARALANLEKSKTNKKNGNFQKKITHL